MNSFFSGLTLAAILLLTGCDAPSSNPSGKKDKATTAKKNDTVTTEDKAKAESPEFRSGTYKLKGTVTPVDAEGVEVDLSGTVTFKEGRFMGTFDGTYNGVWGKGPNDRASGTFTASRAKDGGVTFKSYDTKRRDAYIEVTCQWDHDSKTYKGRWMNPTGGSGEFNLTPPAAGPKAPEPKKK